MVSFISSLGLSLPLIFLSVKAGLTAGQAEQRSRVSKEKKEARRRTGNEKTNKEEETQETEVTRREKEEAPIVTETDRYETKRQQQNQTRRQPAKPGVKQRGRRGT